MSTVEELKHVLTEVAEANKPFTSDEEYGLASDAAFFFLRDHGRALVEALEKSAMWDMCNGTHIEDGVESRFHLIVELNKWKDGRWHGYRTCTPDELAQLLDLARTKASAGGGV